MLHTFAGVFLGAATFIGGLLGFGPDTVATVPQTQTAAIAETRSALAPEETVPDAIADTVVQGTPPLPSSPADAPAPRVLGESTVTVSPEFLTQFARMLQQLQAYLATPAASQASYPRYGGYVPSTDRTIIGTIPANTALASPVITGGSITDASSGSFDALSAGTLTLTSALTGTDATFSGTLTAGTLNVASVSSAGALIGPYFTATSTTATSTFAGAVGIGTTSPNYTLDVNGTINIPLDTDIKAGGIQWMHLSASQVARLYGTAYQLYTGTVRTLRQQVDSSGNFDFNSGQMYIQQSTGNVGIGTTTPGALLGVNGNILGAGTLALTGTTGTTTIASGQGFTIGGSQFVLQQGSGNVGVGTASPAYLLETQSNSNPTINIKNTSASGYSQLFFSNTNGVGRGQIFVNGSTESGFGQPNSMNIYAGGAYDIGLWTNSVERIIVKDTGQVGIGTTTPWGNLSIATGAHTYVEIGRGAAGNNAELVFSTNGALNWMAGLGDDVSNNFYLSTNVGTPSLGAKLTVTTGGNVGVGTTTPNANLVVNGTTGRKLFQVATSTNQSIFTITENAHVGIGTAAPVASLHVLSTDTDGQLRLTYDDSGYSTFFTNLNGNTRFFSSGGNLWVGNSNGTQNTAVSIYNSNSGVSMNGLTLGNMKTTAGSNIKINFVDWSETEISSIRSIHGGTGIGSLAFYTNNTGGSTEQMRISNQGNVGIGTSTPTVQFHTTGTVRFSNFGAGSLQTDADGNVSVSSDERLKNVDGSFTRGLADVLKISPINYHWNELSGLDRETQYTGFSAQNVREAIPEAVGENPNGYLSLNDRPVLAAVVNAIKELAGSITSLVSNDAAQDAEIAALKERIAALEARPVVNPDGSYTITVASQTATPQGAVDSGQTDSSGDTETATNTSPAAAATPAEAPPEHATEPVTTTPSEPETTPEDSGTQTVSLDDASSTPQ